jgi:hypothetical protein
MAVRTATAGTLDTAVTNLFSAFDAYVALRGQAGEKRDSAEKYFLAVLHHKLRERETLNRLLTNGSEGSPRNHTDVACVWN